MWVSPVPLLAQVNFVRQFSNTLMTNCDKVEDEAVGAKTSWRRLYDCTGLILPRGAEITMISMRWRTQQDRLQVLVLCLSILVTAGCGSQINGYLPVSGIAREGFLSGQGHSLSAQGRQIKLWGYVDHGNLYGDMNAKRILGEWWSGEEPRSGTWRFNLKAADDDAVGHSFAVFVANDPERQQILERFVADARAQRPTPVYVRGELFRFEAPTQARDLTGIYMEVTSSADIKFEPPREGVP